MMLEFLPIILECIDQLITLRSTFLTTLAIAFFLAIGGWIGCSYYTTLWNTRYQITKIHHVICAIVASITFCTVIIFQSLNYVLPITNRAVSHWQSELKDDKDWFNQAFIKAYETIKSQGEEDFSKYPHPNKGGSIIPITQDKTRNTLALLYAKESIANFKNNHSYLSKILWADSSLPTEAISKDYQAFFKENPSKNSYPIIRAVTLAAQLISDKLSSQAPDVVFLSRIILVILFFMIQAIPLSLIGWAAYKDLKITV